MPDEIYFAASKGALKLKGVQDSGIKKKKKSKKKDGLPSSVEGGGGGGAAASTPSSGSGASQGALRTKAERHFMDRQRMREEFRIKIKASKSHKEKVEEFNRNLDSQSEHFDIPKVSWTK